MTREEAKKTLKTLLYYPVGTVPKDKCVDALNMAIEALEQETVSRETYDHEFNLRKEFEMKVFELEKKIAEQEPTAEYSSDVISREEVKKQTTKKNSIWNTITDSSGRGLDEILDSIPSAQPFTTEQIQTMQELESAQIEKAYELGKADRPTGHWIENAQEYYEMINEKGGGVDENTPYFTDDIACSECLAKFSVIDNETERFDFCPNCGCSMKGADDE